MTPAPKFMLDTNVFDALYTSGHWQTAHRLHGRAVTWLTTPMQEQELSRSPNRNLQSLPRDVYPPVDSNRYVDVDQRIALTARQYGAGLVTDDKRLAAWCAEQLPELPLLSSTQLIAWICSVECEPTSSPKKDRNP